MLGVIRIVVIFIFNLVRRCFYRLFCCIFYLICYNFFLFFCFLIDSLILDIYIDVQLYIALINTCWFLLYLVVCIGLFELDIYLVFYFRLQRRFVIIKLMTIDWVIIPAFCLVPDDLLLLLIVCRVPF